MLEEVSAACGEENASIRYPINIWSLGNQTRGFMFIDDCLKGINLIMNSEILEPINLGSSEVVAINQLVDAAEEIAGFKLQREYNLNAPKGVNGRNSDNTLIQKYLSWGPNTALRTGLKKSIARSTTSIWLAKEAKQELFVKPQQLQDRSFN